ncbi:hypothetical protein WG68_03110 [Arsukibacterium ikkense]|uniref:Uncharacterized protein n=1 Tax=Arsukibacterium ikkense TaxID=336831 RepID=A0A0M2V7W2_9GAMM|nr:hypothetical protein [Arsukibacterium ikkense]KKO46942.1 hypothetical protein WG68_03110 [Arsukibacterium ikkense]
MSNHDSDDELAKLYKNLKAGQPMPMALKQRIRQQAKQRISQNNWRSWGYFSQFALGCTALVLVLSWVNPAKLPTYYQIDTVISAGSSNMAELSVQWHHLTAASTDSKSKDRAQTERVQQRLSRLQQQQRELQQAGTRATELQRQVGLLTQHDDEWQIAMCDNKQLHLALELVHELSALMQIAPQLQPQWVELQFAPSGYILAIAALPASGAERQCPSPQPTVVQQQS